MLVDKFNIDGTKIHQHIDKLYHWQYGDRVSLFPIYVEISPVGHCNHRCTFCAVDYIGYKVRRIDTHILINTVQNMAENKVRSIMYAGEGEPLLHPDIGKITVETKRAGIDVAFTTNGIALTENFIENALHAVTWMKVSINAGDKETYAKIHQTKETDWDKVWNNLQRAVVRRSKDTTIGVQCVILPDNITSLRGLIRKAKEIGLDYTVLKPYSQHKSSLTHTYENVRYENQIKELESLSREESTDVFSVICRSTAMNESATTQIYHKCYSTNYFWSYIMSDGSVYGCSAYLLDDRFKYGNINNQLFSEIWLGDKRKSCIDYVDNKLDITECRKNCRMNQVNKELWSLKHPPEHRNFI